MSAPSRDAIISAFAARHGEPPAAIFRAPGRVNLIGEHTDYSHLPVLPIAIERGLTVAAAPAPGGVVEAASSAFAGEPVIDRANPAATPAIPWSRYLTGALRELANVAPGRGARLLIDGDLPAGGGLSSSSALTVGVIAALAAAWDVPLPPGEIVRRAVVSERHAGVESGGMDQEVIVFAEDGAALRIDFDPPGHRAVPLPAGLAFVAASSGEDAPKAGAARDAYNERVVGARIATAMLADEIGLEVEHPLVLRQVAGVDVIDVLVDGLPERISAAEAAHGIDLDVEQLVRLTAGRFDHQLKVPVRRVARHILGEAERVGRAEAALLAGDLPAFGRLLNESHNSLREDFRCSTAALDRLCAAMRKSGASGARLTGAGFGGYALAAAPPASVAAIIEAAVAATGGPAFEVHASAGLERL
ncbi:MAG: hypothetical protein HS107_14620 [Thermoflexaceae bacterium]|nr:hypothetical protein [Thermoflexaceae bacterium]